MCSLAFGPVFSIIDSLTAADEVARFRDYSMSFRRLVVCFDGTTNDGYEADCNWEKDGDSYVKRTDKKDWLSNVYRIAECIASSEVRYATHDPRHGVEQSVYYQTGIGITFKGIVSESMFGQRMHHVHSSFCNLLNI